IARRHEDQQDYTLDPETPLAQAIKRMRLFDVSQMAVLDRKDRVVGIIDESDVLLALTHHLDNSRKPVRDFMTSRIETIAQTASINDLMPIFRADRVAIIAEGDRFYGLITRIDLINYLRTQLP